MTDAAAAGRKGGTRHTAAQQAARRANGKKFGFQRRNPESVQQPQPCSTPGCPTPVRYAPAVETRQATPRPLIVVTPKVDANG